MSLSVQDIHIQYNGTWVLQNFNLQVADGEFVALVGPSGCGKSTLLNLIAGLLPRSHGSVYVDDLELTGISPFFSLMPQEDLLFPFMTILDNVCLYGKIHGGEKELRKKALALFDSFGLGGYENAYPCELSGGMRQRAAFLRTTLSKAKILLLDEPFAALDVITRQEMQDWLLGLRRETKSTILLVTHDIDEALYLADRVLVLGGQPATIRKELSLENPPHSRDWLFQQGALRKELYQALKEG